MQEMSFGVFPTGWSFSEYLGGTSNFLWLGRTVQTGGGPSRMLREMRVFFFVRA